MAHFVPRAPQPTLPAVLQGLFGQLWHFFLLHLFLIAAVRSWGVRLCVVTVSVQFPLSLSKLLNSGRVTTRICVLTLGVGLPSIHRSIGQSTHCLVGVFCFKLWSGGSGSVNTTVVLAPPCCYYCIALQPLHPRTTPVHAWRYRFSVTRKYLRR